MKRFFFYMSVFEQYKSSKTLIILVNQLCECCYSFLTYLCGCRVA